jgi:NUDIX domain
MPDKKKIDDLSCAFSTAHEIRAAGILLYACDTGRYLALHSAKENCWGIAGGKAEEGESFEAAAKRELKEETGYTGSLLNMTALPVNRAVIPHGIICYQTYFAMIPHEFDVRVNGECMDAKWVKGFGNWPQPRQRGIDFLEQHPDCTRIIAETMKLPVSLKNTGLKF